MTVNFRREMLIIETTIYFELWWAASSSSSCGCCDAVRFESGRFDQPAADASAADGAGLLGWGYLKLGRQVSVCVDKVRIIVGSITFISNAISINNIN